ncbi:hypothetical protein P171DRAFT_497675 [Karstenula rhodostoma CBS 690.94]|uniref:Uncharacterized protein n=1 Tax=Karstenula rhodostoma CBS 690.94 TaxID=1392251 RepID=A0A9P4PAH5_9PLEO|nr:hypothetical protein P171DRAFT_497675 [Karstenula rhodostoma CBS 690.94]
MDIPRVMSCVYPLAQDLIPGTYSDCQFDGETIFPLEQFGGGADDATIVLPSSDSIRSTNSDDTVSSWRTSSSGSTLATSITSSLSKTASIVWGGFNRVVRPNRFSATSRWIQDGSWPQFGQEDIHAEALPLQTLSGCGTYAGCNQTRSPCCEGEESKSIRLKFDFGCRSHIYELEYAVFRQWKYVSLLVSAVQEEGVNCALIWDECERLQVMAGDWEARVTPGWQVTIFCEDDNVDDDEEEDDWSEVDNEKDDPWDIEKGYGGEWWFKLWKTRVERKKEGRIKKQKPWMIGVVAVAGIGVAFSIVTWLSSREHRLIALD